MKAKITVDEYRCAPDGHTVVAFARGAIVTGEVARMALADRAAQRMLETKVEGPTETKRGRKK